MQINKPNSNKLFTGGKKVKFSFIPTIFSSNDFTVITPIVFTKKNCDKMNNFFKTKMSKVFMTYCFDDISPLYISQFSPEVYKLSNISINLEKLNNVVVIILYAVIKKYD